MGEVEGEGSVGVRCGEIGLEIARLLPTGVELTDRTLLDKEAEFLLEVNGLEVRFC